MFIERVFFIVLYSVYCIYKIKGIINDRASLVPVFSFGENDLYYQANNPQGSLLRRFQEFFKEHIGFSPPLFYGRGIFNYTFGLLPLRKPIHTIGKILIN